MKRLKIFILSLLFISCKDDYYLNELPDKSMTPISTSDQAQAILDNIEIMRETPALPEVSADNYYLPPDSSWESKGLIVYNAYLWKPDIYQGQSQVGDWFKPYQQVYYCNSVLEALPHLTGTNNTSKINNIKGSALFIRAYSFYNLAVTFSNLYSVRAGIDSCIPLRLTSNPEVLSKRTTVQATYDLILGDLQDACKLLPQAIDPKRKNRPSVPAVYALLARIYLSMGDYVQAKAYADSCLKIYAVLTDYNNIYPTSGDPFTPNGEEVIYQSSLLSTTDVFNRNDCYVDTNLYRSYSNADLRKEIYYKMSSAGLPIPGFSYSGSSLRFSGLATDEMYLIRAECNARSGRVSDALTDLNSLLIKRWKTGTFTPLSDSAASTVLEWVIKERRKELVFRGIRWIDVRRLNRENQGITLKRIVKDKEYRLDPDDNRFVLPIPPDVLLFNPGMSQNPR